MLGDLIASIVNPSAEQLARSDAWIRRHPWLAALALAAPALAAAWLEGH